ncbi:MAG: LysM peptidoglycan-binding domain-containing protein [Candidatus Aminicenantes bacterium]|nr:LysM peptidoglycan-binding domain-containing protein [Candidatus Aminicenantes bacterium]
MNKKQIFSSIIVCLSFLLVFGCTTKQIPPQDVPQLSPSIAGQDKETSNMEEPLPQNVQPEVESIQAGDFTKEIEKDPGYPKISGSSSEILEEALEAYQDAQRAWDRADVDTALAALDESYSLILQIDLPPDSPLIQDKNDLRLLIAQRIQEIYASHIHAVSQNHNSIPFEENKWVLEEIQRFQTSERKYFMESYQRSGRYRDMILQEIKETGLPEELSWIPVIESGFKVKAYSQARALGLWQFISSTGYRFGLKRDRWVDERMDPEKATRAALKYLEELHSFFGDWTTALAAYNCGEFRIQRQISAQRINYLDNFWDLFTMLPRETARFVPRFIATVLIIKNPEKYGFELPEPDPPLKFQTIQINRPVKLSSLSQKLGLSASALAELNPELRYDATPEGTYELKIPPGLGEQTVAAVDSLSRWIPPEATYVIHYVRRGETVSHIAERYRTSTSTIARLNNLNSRYLIRPGQRLKVPSQGGSSAAAPPPSLELTKEGEKLIYVVKRGDSLYQIARAFNTSVDRIKQLNNLRSNIINVGQKLEISSGGTAGSTQYTVVAGDTPFKIAQQFNMSLNTLLTLNGLTTQSKIYPGQKLWVTK